MSHQEICCTSCKTVLAKPEKAEYLNPQRDMMFLCRPCFESALRHKIYLVITGQSDELVYQHVDDEKLDKIYKEVFGK
jgi:hypothetical protein